MLPGEWEEVNSKQLKRLAVLLHSGLDSDMAKQKALHILSGKSLLMFLLLPLDLRHRAQQYAEWVFGKVDLTIQLIPKYKKFYGPDSDFGNLSMVEFHYTEMAYCDLILTKDEKHLTELIAVLYREGKEAYDFDRNVEGDFRKTFSHGLFEYGQKQIAKWPKDVKLAILLWYDGCRQSLVKGYPDIYPKKEKTRQIEFQGLYKMMRSVAGDKYGTIPEVEKMSVHTGHLEISCMLEDQANMKKEIDKLK
jgi:hypothetical protein